MQEKLIQMDLEASHLSIEDQDKLHKIQYYWDQSSTYGKIDCLLAMIHPGTTDVVEGFVDEIIDSLAHYPYGKIKEREKMAQFLWDRLRDEEQIKFVLQQAGYAQDEYAWMEDHIDTLATYFKLDKKKKEWLHFNGFPLHVNDFYSDFWTQFGRTIHEHLLAFLQSKNVHYIQELSLHEMFEFYDAYAGRAIY